MNIINLIALISFIISGFLDNPYSSAMKLFPYGYSIRMYLYKTALGKGIKISEIVYNQNLQITINLWELHLILLIN